MRPSRLSLGLCSLVVFLVGATPAAATTETFDVAKDAWVWSVVPANNIGHTGGIELGRTLPKSGQPVNRKRALLHFDIAAIPTGRVITSAVLRLYVERTSSDPLGLGLTAARLSAPFVEGDGTTGVTWDTQPGVEASPTDTATMNGPAGQWFEMDVTAVVAAEYASAHPGDAWLRIAPTDETTIEERDLAARSREYGGGTHPPQLVVSYEIPTPTFTPTPVPPPTSTVTATSTPTATATPTESGLPPDPATIAPPLDRSVATGLFTATEFLWSGADLIQSGVAPGSIDPRRAAVIRGRVLRRDGAPLPAITVRVAGSPDLGSTLTRTDGRFDLVVNGGGVTPLELVDEADDGIDYIPIHRQVDVPWGEYVEVADAAMIPYDVATPVTVPDPMAIQVVSGTASIDADGTRTARVLFPPLTTASFTLADGSTVPFTGTLHVRATEYTVGPLGPAAMPAPLPPSSGYTYAVELSADEALQAGAERVEFSQPVYFYLENFLGFPTGSAVPTGYYDRVAGQWVASDNGRVIAILDEDAEGRALLDTDGDGLVDNDVSGELGIDAAERATLGGTYASGQTLWRVPITHFTPWDCNWPYGPDEDAEDPDSDVEEEEEEDDPCLSTGSVLECENQTLGEEIPIVGTPFRLVYRSDRVLGNRRARTRIVRLSGANVPESLQRVELDIRVAGQVHRQTFARTEGEPASVLANLSTTFVWDGLDVYGRLVEGAQRASFEVGYVYEAVYYPVEREFERSFAGFRPGTIFATSRARQEITLKRRIEQVLGTSDARAMGFGGWTLDAQHRFDPTGQKLELGTGGQRSARQLPKVLTGHIGGGASEGEGVAASEASLRYPGAVATGADGSVYTAEVDTEYNPGSGLGFGLALVRRTYPDGSILTVAGNRPLGRGFSGDGGPAVAAQLNTVVDLAVGTGGEIYIADFYRVRRVDAEGVITTVAGNGVSADGGDGGPAFIAGVSPSALAIGRDGSVYIGSSIEGASDRIRRIGADGTIDTLAGGGLATAEGVPADEVYIGRITGLALAPDGSLLYTDDELHQVRRVDRSGIVRTVAGTGTAGFSGDGGAAIAAQLDGPSDVDVARDGSVYITEEIGNRVRYIDPTGIITSIAGGGFAGPALDDGVALGADLGWPEALALAPYGGAYVAQPLSHLVSRIDVASQAELIPSTDGALLFEFDADGRHQRTRHGLTGNVVLDFDHDAGRLATITDGDGNVTMVSHDAGSAIIEGPFHQQTTLAFDANGYLASVTNPAGETVEVTHDADGMLRIFEDARHHAWEFTYDAAGRLERDDDPAGGFQTLARMSIPNGYQVTRTTAEGRNTVYALERFPEGGRVRRVTGPDGTVSETIIGPDGQSRQTAPS